MAIQQNAQDGWTRSGLNGRSPYHCDSVTLTKWQIQSSRKVIARLDTPTTEN